MNDIQKVSEITYQDAADYLHIEEVTPDIQQTLKTLKRVAVAFIVGYTGLTEAELDIYPDFVIVVLILVQDMYDNRTRYVDGSNLNQTVEAILGMHRVNLL